MLKFEEYLNQFSGSIKPGEFFLNLFITAILVGAVVAPYFMKGRDGQPLMDAKELIPKLPTAPVTVYRWKDEFGVWQFGEEPPAGADAEPMVVDSEANSTRLEAGWQVTPLTPDKTTPKAMDLTNPLKNLQQPIESAKAAAKLYEQTAQQRAP